MVLARRLRAHAWGDSMALAVGVASWSQRFLKERASARGSLVTTVAVRHRPGQKCQMMSPETITSLDLLGGNRLSLELPLKAGALKEW